MLKWEQATYQGANETWVTVHVDELQDLGYRSLLQDQELWDIDREYRLLIRSGPGRPHFYSLTKRLRFPRSRGETSKRHADRVKKLLEQLQSQHYLFGYRTFENGTPIFNPLFNSKNYAWAKEVTRTLSGEIQWRHDLFGAEATHRHTERYPWIAIEVIDSHFPDEAVLETWLELSSRFPYFVVFDFVERRNYYLEVDQTKQQVRVVYFIYDGSMWRSGAQWNKCTATFFKEKVRSEILRDWVINPI